MRNVVVFIDLFSLLAIALFVYFVVAQGDSSKAALVSEPVVFEVAGVLEGGDAGANAEIFQYVKLVPSLVSSDGQPIQSSSIVETGDSRRRHFVFSKQGTAETLRLTVEGIDNRAFAYETFYLEIARIFPRPSNNGYRHRVGEGSEYEVPIN
ncbi:hypothetical protein EOA25_21685 [Mesorhizobium sp. M2A.F.Ca.ET.040.01.1.1]|nr:hypothetical protein EOA25_21685 [Mesorhizobium sp. M2A.F.Ca.ET.040.01.1.1]